MSLVALFTIVCCIIFFYTISSQTSDNGDDDDATIAIFSQEQEPSFNVARSRFYVNDPLISAITNSDYDQVEQLIESGEYPVDFTDEDSATPLFYAAGYGDYRMVEILLELNANPNALDDDDNSPLHAAVDINFYDRDRYKIVKLLKKYGADSSIVNIKGKTPLDYARTDKMRHILQAS